MGAHCRQHTSISRKKQINYNFISLVLKSAAASFLYKTIPL